MNEGELLIVSIGNPVCVHNVIVAFDHAQEHTNSYSIWVRVTEGSLSYEREMFKGDKLEIDNDERLGSWVLTGLRDAGGFGVTRPDSSTPTTMVFRRVRSGDHGTD